jgi:hypothetical protein
MPSESRIQHALAALAAPRERFRSAVAMAVDQVGAFLETRRAPASGRTARTAQELGLFATGRLDAGRFASMFGESGTLDPLALARMERAYEALRQIDARGTELFVVRVPPGGDLRVLVGRGLAEIGSAFGAARAAEMARQGRYPTGDHDDHIGGFAFRRWNRAERQIAPPLVVEVDGADLQVGGLAEFLDGTMKIALLVHGPAPAAPLVRLVTPGVFLMQCGDDAGLAALAAAPAAGVAAVLPDGAARFVHTPGQAPVWARLSLEFAPETENFSAIGSFSAFQQSEELEQLRVFSTAPASGAPTASDSRAGPGAASVAPGTNGVAPSAADPVDTLAAWLLSQADLGGS